VNQNNAVWASNPPITAKMAVPQKITIFFAIKLQEQNNGTNQ